MGFWLFGPSKGDYDPDLLAYVARRSMELMRSFTGQNLATIIWATRRCKSIMNYYQMLCFFEFFGTSFFFWKDTISIVFEDTRYLYVTYFFLNGQIRFTQRLLCEQSQLRLKGHCYHQLQGQPRRSRPLSVFGGWLLEAERYRTSLFLKQIH